MAVGTRALQSQNSASGNIYNTAVGSNAGKLISSGSGNTAVGGNSLDALLNGNNNSALGVSAGSGLISGSNNLFVGASAGEFASTGTENTFVGNVSGSAVTTGSKNTILGRYNGNQGSLDIRTSSNFIVLSDGDGNPRAYFNASGHPFLPAIRASAGTYTAKITSGTAELTYDTSSARYKDNIRDSTYGLSAAMQLQSRMFEYKEDDQRTDVGFIAEEVNEVIPELVVIDSEGRPDAVHYDRITSVLVKAIQEQQEQIEQLKADIAVLKGAN